MIDLKTREVSNIFPQDKWNYHMETCLVEPKSL
jgi:hypothetical protein